MSSFVTEGIMDVRWHDRIALRLSLSIVLVIILTAGTIASLILRDEKITLERDLRIRARQLGEIMAGQTIEPLLYEEKFTLYTLIQSYLNIPDSILVYGSIYNKRGTLLLSGQKASFNGEIKTLTAPPPKTPLFNLNLGEQSVGKPVDFLMPIVAHKTEVVGYLRLGVSVQPLVDTLTSAQHKVWLATAAISFFGILAALWLARILIHPVLLINSAARRMGEGDLGQEIPVTGVGEIRQLGMTFNRMSNRLNKLVATIKAAQENLVRTEKLYALGEFSTGLAHEIKNPLTSIKMLMQRTIEEEEPLCKEDIEVIVEELDRIDLTVSRFLQGAKPSPLALKAKDINTLISDVVAITRTKIEKSGIRLEMDLTPDLPSMQLDSASIKQIFLNGILNALQAMPDGGVLTIATGMRDNELHCVISDTGCGITQEHLKNIFDPFFTTKEEGTGMGLTVAWNIARQHGGHLEIDSHVNQGTSLILVLPYDKTAHR
jgi:signal transduction histidine kinase